MEVSLLGFVQECRHLAKQALGKRAGEPASGGFARWKHVVLHCIRIEDDYGYRELVDRVALMEAVCEELDLDPDDLPKPSTLCKSFDRFEMWVWRQLLRASAQQLPTTGHAAINGTYFERTQPPFHYRCRSGREVQTLKAMFLVDSHTKTVLDIQPSANWRHDTAVGPQVACRNAGDLRSLAADKGYDKNAFGGLLWDNDVRPLVRHCLYTWYDYAHNARLDDSLYNKRWIAETCFSVVKRSHGRAVRAQAWYREFRDAASNSPSTTSNEPPKHYDPDAVSLFNKAD
jgi:IS5 family transposase